MFKSRLNAIGVFWVFGKHKLTAGLDLKALFQPKGFSDFQGLSLKVTACPSWVVSVHTWGFPSPGMETSPTELTDPLSQGKAERATTKSSILLPVCSLGWGAEGLQSSQHKHFPFLQFPSPFGESWWSPWQRSTTPWQGFWQKLQQKSSFSGSERCSNLPTTSLAGCISN